jgi:hypothetical protein
MEFCEEREINPTVIGNRCGLVTKRWLSPKLWVNTIDRRAIASISVTQQMSVYVGYVAEM